MLHRFYCVSLVPVCYFHKRSINSLTKIMKTLVEYHGILDKDAIQKNLTKILAPEPCSFGKVS